MCLTGREALPYVLGVPMPQILHGCRVMLWRRRRSPYRPRQWSSPRKITWRAIVKPDRWYLVAKLPGSGWQVFTAGMTGASVQEAFYRQSLGDEMMKKRMVISTAEGGILPALPATSTMLNKTPLLREFLSATQYEDKTPRTPGYMTLRNKVTVYEVTLYDPDSGTRLAACHSEIDKVLALAETMLGVEDQLWEVDRYLTEMLEKKAKKKKK